MNKNQRFEKIQVLEYLENKRGITLVALVVTIIVLLILSSVTLQMLMNDNGLINKVLYAKEQKKYSIEEESLKIVVLAAQSIGNGELNTENLNKEIKIRFGNNAEVTETSLGWIYKGQRRYIISKDGNIKVYESLLPSEYQQVEYIESSGFQYIDTNYLVTSNNVRIVTDYIYSGTSVLNALFGMYNKSGKNGEEWIITAFGGSQLKFYVGNSEKVLQVENSINVKHHLDVLANNGDFVLEFDGKKYNTKYSGDLSKTYSNYLFCQQNAHAKTAEGHSPMKLYCYTMYDNDKKVRDFIPCYRKDDEVVGLYDLVSNEFYVNSGTGNFKRGSNVD